MQFSLDELKALLGQMQIDIFILNRELKRAEEVNAALYLELHPSGDTPHPVKNGKSPVG